VVIIRRIALLYSVLDGQHETGGAHLEAARAVWDYSFASADYLFGHRTGDVVADTILRLLRSAKAAGVTRWEISNHFGRNVSQARIEAALSLLAEMRVAKMIRDPRTGGRPAERWVAVHA
jgi:hypothetical protein